MFKRYPIIIIHIIIYLKSFYFFNNFSNQMGKPKKSNKKRNKTPEVNNLTHSNQHSSSMIRLKKQYKEKDPVCFSL